MPQLLAEFVLVHAVQEPGTPTSVPQQNEFRQLPLSHSSSAAHPDPGTLSGSHFPAARYSDDPHASQLLAAVLLVHDEHVVPTSLPQQKPFRHEFDTHSSFAEHTDPAVLSATHFPPLR